MKDIQVTSFSIHASEFDPVVDVKQLRLDNWLQSFIIFNDGMGTTSKKCISPFRVDLKTMEMLSDSQGRLFATMEPIPLTPEILGKAGFKRHKHVAGSQDMWARMDAWSIKGSYNWLFRGSPNCLHLVGYFNTQIQYVHQLQNIFAALTGEELEIILSI